MSMKWYNPEEYPFHGDKTREIAFKKFCKAFKVIGFNYESHYDFVKLLQGECTNRCLPPCQPPHTDHPRLLKIETGEIFFITQPYSLTDEEIEKTVDWCKNLGVNFTILSREQSFHSKGATLLLIFMLECDTGQILKGVNRALEN